MFLNIHIFYLNQNFFAKMSGWLKYFQKSLKSIEKGRLDF